MLLIYPVKGQRLPLRFACTLLQIPGWVLCSCFQELKSPHIGDFSVEIQQCTPRPFYRTTTALHLSKQTPKEQTPRRSEKERRFHLPQGVNAEALSSVQSFQPWSKFLPALCSTLLLPAGDSSSSAEPHSAPVLQYQVKTSLPSLYLLQNAL